MTAAENAALKALVLADATFAAAGKVYTGRAVGANNAPITNTWYVVIQPGADADSQTRLTGSYVHRRPSTTFQCVGTTPDQAISVTERLDRVLRPNGRGVILAVPGERTGPLRRDYIGPAQIDPDVSPPMWFQTVEYSFRSQPIA
jgi:hypothetical protein